jgi:hypothetical protein
MWGENMRSNRTFTTFALVTLTVLCVATIAFAVTIRGSSGNGEDSNAPNWLLQGRNLGITISGNGKKANMSREIVCLDQDVENALPSPTLTRSGGCDTGDYMHVFQFQTSATNLSVTIGHLSGFDPTNASNFGVMICDSASNTIEMCTNDPTGTHIPTNITATTTSISVTFTIPNAFPSYPVGTPQQGRGLTFFVITHQNNPLPISLPFVFIQ